ncbi:MAG: MarR family transcriptional regulator [Leucobacter sp.]
MPASDETRQDRISEIITEFSEILSFARKRWTSYANEMHPELRGAGVAILQVIARRGPVTATGISQVLDMDKALVSRQISKLRELGFVEAELAPDDRRVTLLRATTHAKELLAEVRERWAGEYHERLAGWTADDLEALRDGLHRFNTAAHDIEIDGPAGRCAREHREEPEV